MSIGRVHINFIDRVALTDVLVVSPKNDTLLNAGRLDVDISLLALLKNTISVQKVELQNTSFRLTQNTTDSTFNFQYIIDAFASTDTTPKKPSKPWTFAVDRVLLSHVKGLIDLPVSKVKINVDVGNLAIRGDVLDLTHQTIKAKSIKLQDSKVALTLYASDKKTLVQDTVAPKSVSSGVDSSTGPLIPDIGWNFGVEKTEFANDIFSMDDEGRAKEMYGFDPLHMYLSGINFTIESATYNGPSIRAIVRSLSVKDRSGLEVKQLKAAAVIDPWGMSISDLDLETKGSKLTGKSKIEYDDFDSFIKLAEGSKVKSELKGYVSTNELTRLVPSLISAGYIPLNDNGKINLDWKLDGDVNDLKAERFKISTGARTVVDASFKVKGLSNLQQLNVDLHLSKVATTYTDVKKYLGKVKLPDGLDALGTVLVSGHVYGPLRNLTADSLLITSSGATVFRGNAHAHGLPNIDTTQFDVAITELNVLSSTMALAFGKEVPAELLRLGKISYQGTYNGTIYDMALDGTLSTELGSLNTNLQAKFEKDYSNASYQGILALNQLDVGTLLAQKDLGPVSLSATLDGQGLTIDQLKGNINAVIQQAEYRTYKYKNILINGAVDRKEFNGTLNINDPNLKLDFNGLVSFNDTLPRFKFSALLDTLNVGKLHLMAANYGLHSKIDVDFRGIQLDRFMGKALLNDINMSSDSMVYHLDSISARARFVSGKRKGIHIVSPIFDARIRGEMNLAELPDAVIAYFDRQLPINTNNGMAADTSALEDVELSVSLNHPVPFIRLFVPSLLRLDTASITGTFNNKEKNFELHVLVPGVTYDSINVDTIRFNSVGDGNRLTYALQIDSANYGSQLQIPYIKFNGNMEDKVLNMALAIAGDSLADRLALQGALSHPSMDAYSFSLKDSFYLNGSRWQVNPDNAIVFGNQKLNIQNFAISKETQSLSVTSDADTFNSPVSLDFGRFQIKELSKLVDFAAFDIGGVINGGLTLRNPMKNLSFTAMLWLDGLTVNKEILGNMSIKGVQLEDNKGFDVALELHGPNNELDAQGNFSADFKKVDLNVQMPSLRLASVEPFLAKNISESKGTISADLQVTGDIASPEVNGSLGTHDLATRVRELNTRFKISDSKIAITPNLISLPTLIVTDESQRTATLKGVVHHHNFGDISFDLDFNTTGFGFMNTTKKDNSFYYGTVVMALDASIKGKLSLPEIDANAKTLKGTKFTIVPSNMQEGVEKENFIIFHSPRVYGKRYQDSFLVAKEDYKVQVSGVDLNLNFEMTNDADLVLVVDPVSGDSLECSGHANLSVEVPAVGPPQVNGTYTIDSGQYRFSQEKVFKRKFVLQKGGTIVFAGDPLNARLDIVAYYLAKATTYELIANQSSSLSSDELEASHLRTSVQVLMNLKGELSAPEISFDIQLPSDQSNISTSTAARQLAQIREDQTELNKQVFGLLLFNSFIADQTSSVDVASTGENVALSGVSSVSGLINNQLSKLADKVEGFSINLNVDSYVSKGGTDANGTTSGNNMVTEAQLAVSKSLFNDRLVITLGGNVNLENSISGGQSSATNSSALSNVAGDFTIEYKLTANGRYRVKVFQTTNYDALNQDNLFKTGVGLTFHESFRSLRDKRKEKNKNDKDKPKTEEPKK